MTLRHLHLPNHDGEPEFLRHKAHFHHAHAQLCAKRVRTPPAPLRRVGKGEEKSFVAPGQRLKALIFPGGERHGLARQVKGLFVFVAS